MANTLPETLLAHEPTLRLGIFAGVLALLLLLEQLAPRRTPHNPRTPRRLNNLALVGVSTLLLRLTFPLLGVGAALLAQSNNWGLLNQFPAPLWLALIASIIALDLSLYLQHRLFHAVPLLWRLHRTHHADPDLDVTTALRFHPLEIALSMLLKLAAITALGAPPAAVLIFEILLNAAAMFNHANLNLPLPLDRALRRIIVTPDMHRVHHSTRPDETNKNFGFNLALWDHLFKTYKSQPTLGHHAMIIGQPTHRTPRDQWLDRLLTQPFQKEKEPPAAGG